jgi:hypothetical protein
VEFTLRWREEYVPNCQASFDICANNLLHFTVTDMLVAVLNTCTKEELEESESDEEAPVSPTSSPDSAERRKIIKGKILAVGRMARVFALLRFVHLKKNHTINRHWF